MSIIKTFTAGLGETKSVLVDVTAQPRAVKELKKLSSTTMIAIKSTSGTQLKMPAPQPLAHVSLDNKAVAKPIKEVVQEIVKQTVKVSHEPQPQINLNPYSIVSSKDLTSGVDFGTSARKSTDYELDTGISEIRPQVIAITGFQPLYDNTKKKNETPAGSYYRSEVFSRNLKQENIKRAITIANQVNIDPKKNSSDSVKSNISLEKIKNEAIVKSLKSISDTFLSLVQNIDGFKSKLNVRDDQKAADIQKAISDYISTYASQRSLEAFILSSHPDQYDITDVLASLGYDKNNVENVFSSTKIWLQLAYETKLLLKNHSLDLIDNKSIDKQLDANPVTIAKNKTARFDFNTHQPDIILLNVLKDIQPSNVSDSISIIENAYSNIYSNISFLTDEAKICAFLNLIAKENRYSYALSQQNVKNVLTNYYGYSVSDSGNTQVFDFAVGQFGDTIADAIASSDKSLAAIAQQVVDNRVVLTFENKHVAGTDVETLPGSLVYADSLLNIDDSNNFSTQNIRALQTNLQKTLNSFSLFSNGFNLLLDDPQPTDMASVSDTSILSNPKLLFDRIASPLVDTNGKSLPLITNDTAASIFKIALTNNKIKSLLFVYFITKLSRSNSTSIPFFSTGVGKDNVTTIQAIVDQLIAELDIFLKNYQKIRTTEAPNVIDGITISSIKSMLLGTTSGLINYVSDLLKIQITAMQKDNAITINGATRYGAHADTILTMSFFECVLTIVVSVAKQEFLGRDTDTSKGERYLYFQQLTTSKTTKNRLNNIKAKLNQEIALTQQAIFSMLGTLSNLSIASQNLLNYVETSSLKLKVIQLVSIMADKKLVKYFLTKQQIMLFSYKIASILNRMDEQKSSMISFFDENYVSQQEQEIISKFFEADAMLSQNKNILSVGIPIGFVDKLHQSIDVKTVTKSSFNAKQNDIINVCVYKLDGENPHIIFKPKKFLLETSRLNGVGDKTIRNSDNPINSLATFNLSDYSSQNNNFEFYPQLSNSKEKIAFQDQTYNFLSNDQKAEIHRNTVTSYMLEKYMSVLTGITLSQTSFPMVNNQIKMNEALVQQIIDAEISAVVQRKNSIQENFVKTGVLFPADPVENNRQGLDTLITDPIDQIVRRDIKTAISMLVTTSDMTSLTSNISEGNSFQKKILCPQKFDRIFHFLIGTNDFIIDRESTCTTEFGKSALNNLLSNGYVEEKKNSQGNLELKFKEKSKNDAVIFDKYFVTIETSEAGILN